MSCRTVWTTHYKILSALMTNFKWKADTCYRSVHFYSEKRFCCIVFVLISTKLKQTKKVKWSLIQSLLSLLFVCFFCLQIRHEVSFKTVTHKICSDTCFNVYRRANGLIMNCCEQCGDYLPSRASANHFLLVDGQQKRFCCHNCIRDFKQVL